MEARLEYPQILCRLYVCGGMSCVYMKVVIRKRKNANVLMNFFLFLCVCEMCVCVGVGGYVVLVKLLEAFGSRKMSCPLCLDITVPTRIILQFDHYQKDFLQLVSLLLPCRGGYNVMVHVAVIFS